MKKTAEEHNSEIEGLNHFMLDLLGVKFCPYNPNPEQDLNDDCDREDCAIRSSCKFLNKSWSEVYKDMSNLCMQNGVIIGNRDVLIQYLSKFNVTKLLDLRNLTVAEFLYKHKKGRYVIMTCQHAVCYINGNLYDSTGCMYGVNDFLSQYVHVVIRKQSERKK